MVKMKLYMRETNIFTNISTWISLYNIYVGPKLTGYLLCVIVGSLLVFMIELKLKIIISLRFYRYGYITKFPNIICGFCCGIITH